MRIRLHRAPRFAPLIRAPLRLTLGLMLALGPSIGCSGKYGPSGKRGQGAGETGEQEAQATPVRVLPLGNGPIEDRVTSASTIEAERQVTVHAEATGRVLEIGFEEGDVVKKGAVLARVRRDMQASSVDRAVTNRDKLETDLKRVQALHDSGAASREELANAALTLRSAEIDVRDRRRDLSNTKVLAPFGGTITDRFVNAGAFVTSGQQLYGITDFDTLVARVYVPEKELDRIRVGQAADVVGKAAANRRATGKVARIAPRVDATTGTIKVTVELPPPNSPDQVAGSASFLPGMYAEVVLTTERHDNALLIPKAALVREEEQTFVFIVEAGEDAEKTVAKRRLVELGLSAEEFVEALSGVETGERVVVAGQIGLKDGAEVEVVEEAKMPTDGGAELATASGASGTSGTNGSDGQAEGT